MKNPRVRANLLRKYKRGGLSKDVRDKRNSMSPWTKPAQQSHSKTRNEQRLCASTQPYMHLESTLHCGSSVEASDIDSISHM